MKSSLANILFFAVLSRLGSEEIVAFAPIHTKTSSSIRPSQSTTATTTTSTTITNTNPRSYKSSHSMIPSPLINDVSPFSPLSSSHLISTISADIDNIPQDDFGTVFAGGIAVMIGGVLSTLIVGFLLERGDSYANVVAESYAQGGDEEFWRSLSPDDQERAREMLEKLRESKKGRGEGEIGVSVGGGGGGGGGLEAGSSTTVRSSSSSSSNDAKEKTSTSGNGDKKENGKKEAVSMFSDYDD
mmetsp:Transcript_7464/g.14130  ORF Transcript_7464/g.14130 Transcript_7464/m.14130 type:complete len:243 (+) Transcript_7464:158-886(+)